MKRLYLAQISAAFLLVFSGNAYSSWGGSISGGFKHATSSVSKATKHVGSTVSNAAKHVGSTASNTTKRVGSSASNTTKHVGSVASNTTKHVGGVASSSAKHIGGTAVNITKRLGGVTSTATKNAGGAVSNSAKGIGGAVAGNPAIQKMKKGPGPNENTIIRETYQGALSGAATGAAAGSIFPGAGTVAGAESGAVGGAATGFGQGVYDTNKDYFRARDPGRHMPQWAKPNTQVRLGYQGGLKAAAGTLIGDYSTGAATGAALGTNMLKSAAAGGAFTVAAHDDTSVTTKAREGAISGATTGARVGSVFGPAGTLAGAELGARGGATTAIAQQAYDANKTSIKSADPGRNLPQWARPSSPVRVGYQSALKGSAAGAVGDFHTAGEQGKTVVATVKNATTSNQRLMGTKLTTRRVSIQPVRSTGVDLRSTPTNSQP